MPPSLRAWATAMAACLTLAFAAQSCGVIPSSDCAERATCSGGGGGASGSSGGGSSSSGSGGDGSGGPSAEAGDDGNGQSDTGTGMMGDVASDDVGSSDVSVEDVTSDATSEGTAAIPDAASEHDASIDVVSQDVAIRDVVSEPCAAYTCAEVPPAGWMGPALLWTGALGSAAPSCPAGYKDAVDAFAGPTGPADTCTCMCTASGQTCSTTQTIFYDQACATTCATAGASNASCTPVSSTSCGNAGSLKAAAPTLSGGTCTPKVTTTPGAPPSWTTSARVCSWGVPIGASGGCGDAAVQCFLAPTAGFAKVCVYQSGAAASCPAAYPTSNVFYSTESDTRACGGCTCGAPTGGTCAGSVNLYTGVACGTAAVTYPTGAWDSCQTFGGNLFTLAEGNFTVTAGTCAVTAQPAPTGGVTGTGPTTVCCK